MRLAYKGPYMGYSYSSYKKKFEYEGADNFLGILNGLNVHNVTKVYRKENFLFNYIFPSP